MNHLTIDFGNLFTAYDVMPIVIGLMSVIGIWTIGCMAMMLMMKVSK
jgi:hypothetical protein